MPLRFLLPVLGALFLPIPAQAGDDLDEELNDEDELEDLDEPAKPSSPREGTTFSITVPLGFGGGPSGTGLAWGLSGAIGGGALSMPLYLVIANGGHAGGQYMIGIRYNAPKVFFIEALAGWVKADASVGATLGAGAGLGFDIPVYRRFMITVGGTVSYAFAQHGVFGLGYAGPTFHI